MEDHGVDALYTNKFGDSALQEAIVYGDGSSRSVGVKRLLDACADPVIRDALGRTALQNAQRSQGSG